MRKICCLAAGILLVSLSVEAQSSAASLRGRVVVADGGQPVANAPIEVVAAGVVEARAVSDDEGRFQLSAVAPGRVRLHVAVEGFSDFVRELDIRPRDTLDVEVRLLIEVHISDQMDVHADPAFLEPRRTASSRFVTREDLDDEAAPIVASVPALAENLLPGAVLGHDNFIHVRGNELSLHEFVNGVSFLDNPHQQFSPGLPPAIFASLNMVTGGFRAEYGNRFGGILDITTLSGAALGGRGNVDLAGGTVATRSAAVDYGGTAGALGYFLYGGTVHSDRYLNPPQEDELHDSGRGGHGTGQLDYLGQRNSWKLLVTGGGTRFELPNTTQEDELGRDARRALDSASAILGWQILSTSGSLLSVSAYARRVEDDLQPTGDEVTTFADGGRTTRTTGLKADWSLSRDVHRLKAGADWTHLRLTEVIAFDDREFFGAGARQALSFSDQRSGDLLGLYLQDQLALGARLTVDLGVRYDQVDILERETQVSPRVGLAYRLPGSESVLRISYNRLFTPPPIEYLLLADALGNPDDGDGAVGGAKAYVQDLIDGGWTRAVGERLFIDLGGYWHTGRNAFENSEISNSRLFVPTNFARAEAWGGQLGVQLRPRGERGWSGRLDYTVARVRFVGPITGGLAGEDLDPGEKIAPAFDQRHTATTAVQYRVPWRHLRAGVVARYGSGTPTEQAIEIGGQQVVSVESLPDHLTADLTASIALWEGGEHGLDFELTLTNISDNRYAIAKESEATPIQFAARRTVQGRLALRF